MLTRLGALGCILVFLAADAMQPAVPLTWAKPDHFWYRKNVAGGNIWLNVDAQHGVKEPLFDHQRLAIELSLRTGNEYTPLTLPFADPASRFAVKYDGSNAYIQEGAMAIEFVLDGYQWRCDLQIKWDWNKVPPTDYECRGSKGSEGSKSSQASKSDVSPDGTLEAFVAGYNVGVRPVGGDLVRMLTTDGVEGDAYDPGSIRWAADSRSLMVYRLNAAIWNSDSVSGSVQKLIVFRTLPVTR